MRKDERLMIRTMLTTIDNPHSPFDDFEAWYAFDVESGYHTCAFLARIVNYSDQLSEADQEYAVKIAIDEIIYENVTGVYKRVTRDI
jgi:hypothetical protein